MRIAVEVRGNDSQMKAANERTDMFSGIKDAGNQERLYSIDLHYIPR